MLQVNIFIILFSNSFCTFNNSLSFELFVINFELFVTNVTNSFFILFFVMFFYE